MVKNSTKVRPVAHATKSTTTPSLRADDKAGSGCCDEHAATADLSDRKHEDFGRSPGTPAQPTCAPQLALTIFSGIFSYAAHAMFGLEAADDVTAERRRSSRFISVIRPVISAFPQRTFRRANFKQLSPEAIRPIRDKDQRNGSLNCATTRLSTCRCAESVAKQQRRETWRKPVAGRQQDFRC
jgi:hypothetical protein